MAGGIRNIVIVATPTAPLLPHLLRALSHEEKLSVTVLTRETSVKLSLPFGNSHDHCHNHNFNGHHHKNDHVVNVSHVQIYFSHEELGRVLRGKEAIICCFTGSDIHLSGALIDVATSIPSIKYFIPSEYGLDTSNAQIRELLPPYKTRYEIQKKLKASGMKWRAIYSGLFLEDALKTDGVLGIDVMWGSVTVFPHDMATRIAISTYKDVANAIAEAAMGKSHGGREELHISSFRVTLEEVVAAVEQELDKKLDEYNGSLEGARNEAQERMKRGYFDGGVSLMSRVAVWDRGIRAWRSWDAGSEAMINKNVNNDGFEGQVGGIVRAMRNGDIGGDGCGC